MVYKRNLADLDWVAMEHGSKFKNERKVLTPIAESYIPKVGCSAFRLEPGQRAFPLHEHLANDEAILITKGSGILQYADEQIRVTEGDYLHLPAASGCAHHMINDSHAPLEYLCISSLVLPEIVLYPESEKLGAISYIAPSEPGERNRMVSFLKHEPVEYWHGESEK